MPDYQQAASLSEDYTSADSWQILLVTIETKLLTYTKQLPTTYFEPPWVPEPGT
ncbi:hypothetical protein [Sabulibacter ruber]|uniref:hypothetical protein n=1 Tax=Sabulibacter ruber TaxID=2811901 RepID=UPI001A971E88|nr:hypothetical protein [Sabulibacter ruber]